MTITIADAVLWPRSLMLQSEDVEWTLDFNTLHAPQTIGGIIQVSSMTAGGLWRATITNQLWLAEHQRLWTALEVSIKDGLIPVILPLFKPANQPWPDPSSITVPHSDETPHDDDTEFEEAVIDIETVGDTDSGAVEMRIKVNKAGTMSAGFYFAFKHEVLSWRSYAVGSISPALDGSGDPIADTYDIVFEPALRGDVLDGTSLEVDNPRNIMKLVGKGALANKVVLGRMSNPTGAFVEQF